MKPFNVETGGIKPHPGGGVSWLRIYFEESTKNEGEIFFLQKLVKKLRKTTYNTRDYYPQKAHFIVLRMVPASTLRDLG